MVTGKLKRDFIASRNILSANIALFHQGHPDLYRVVAAELRKLLCDRPISLVQRLFPQAALHPTMLYRPGEDLTHLALQIPGTITCSETGVVKVTNGFEKHRTPLPLQEWLNQPLLNEKITAREFIKSVADKEAAHADPEFNDALLLAKSVKLGTEELLGLFVVAIGEYVLDVLDMAISANPQAFPVRHSPRMKIPHDVLK